MKRRTGRLIAGVTSTMIVLALLCVPILAQTPAPPAPSQYSAVPPAGHEAFFKDLGELLARYPESAKRFAITDRQVRPARPGRHLKQRHQCPEGQGCGFYCWTSPASFECCECNIRPK